MTKEDKKKTETSEDLEAIKSVIELIKIFKAEKDITDYDSW